MQTINFPTGSTHARQKQGGLSIVVERNHPELLQPEGLKIEYGVYADHVFTAGATAAPVTVSPDSAAIAGVGKTEYVAKLILEEKYTAKQIAQKVVDAFGGTYEKAIALTRAVPYHLKKRGINKTYLKEGSQRDSRVLVVRAAQS